MIQHGYEMSFADQRFGMIIYGAPGTGKTTLAMSDGAGGAKTLVIDLEHGIGRTKPIHRMNASILSADTYEDVKADLAGPEAAAVDTIVIDTCGALVDYLKDWAFRTKPAARTKTGEFNGMKGYGYVKTEIESFTNHIKNVLHKNVIYIFHSDEKADKDGNPQQRLRCEGAFRNTVWTGIDFGGYLQMLDGRGRVLCFTPTQEYHAKGCHGIEGQIQVPELKSGDSNNFVAKLFDQARANMQAEQDELGPQMEAYTKAMEQVKTLVDGISNAETANAAAKAIMEMEHALTSKSEASSMLKGKTASLGLKWSRDAGGYVSAGDQQ